MRKTLSVLLLVMGTIFFVEASAQSGSINTFSPYTMYGVGDIVSQGSASQQAMAGSGIAYRSSTSMNLLNPANLGNTGQRTVMFSMGFEGANVYANSATSSNSYNTFNIRDISLQLSLSSRMGLSFSMTPYSEVGYKIELEETDPDIIANVGQVKYLYEGEGGITQFKLGYGLELAKNLSLGAEVIYYHGSIARSYSAVITPTIQSSAASSTCGISETNISRILYGVGAQYSPIRNKNRALTIAATYKLGGNLNPEISDKVTVSNMYTDTVSCSVTDASFFIPGQTTVGVSYQTSKLALNIDYNIQNWAGLNAEDETNSITYSNSNTIRAGFEYTPDRGNIRSAFKRISYRAGVSTGNYYVKIDDNTINNTALSIGVGMPMKYASLSTLNFGAEFGQRGTTNNGLVRERYIKFSIGFNFFAEDYWFMKQKYD